MWTPTHVVVTGNQLEIYFLKEKNNRKTKDGFFFFFFLSDKSEKSARERQRWQRCVLYDRHGQREISHVS